LYVVKQKCTTANIVIYSDISLFYYQNGSSKIWSDAMMSFMLLVSKENLQIVHYKLL